MSSNLEDLFLANLHLLAPDAPEPQTQVHGLIPGRKHIIDFYWPEPGIIRTDHDGNGTWICRGLVVEVDGLAYQAGGGKHVSSTDYEKINLLALEGYVVLRFTGKMLRRDPYQCIAQVCRALGVAMRELD